MATQLDICNLAVMRLGDSLLTSLAGSKAADLCLAVWDMVLDEALRDIAPNFARTRAVLVPELTAPAWGYAYQYLLPSDCLRALVINDDPTILFQVENRKLLTDQSGVNLKYVKRGALVSSFDPTFTTALAWRIAQELANPLTGGRVNPLECAKAYFMAAAAAKTIDSQENDTQSVSWWDDART